MPTKTRRYSARAIWNRFIKSIGDPEPLIGVSAAADILDVKKANIGKLREAGRLNAVLELASGPLFLRDEVQALADELNAAREARRGSD